MPVVVSALPGMEAMATMMMKQKIKKHGVASLEELRTLELDHVGPRGQALRVEFHSIGPVDSDDHFVGLHLRRTQAASASIQRILDKPVKLAEIRSVALEALEQTNQS